MNSADLYERVCQELILREGFPTYGGLAGRDLEALAIGIEEILDEQYLKYRIASTAYVGNHLAQAGVPLLKPIGGHAVYLDGRKFCDHLPDEQLPGWALSVALYEHVGVRACEIGNVMFGTQDPKTGSWTWPALDLVRLGAERHVDADVDALQLHDRADRLHPAEPLVQARPGGGGGRRRRGGRRPRAVARHGGGEAQQSGAAAHRSSSSSISSRGRTRTRIAACGTTR